MFDFGCRQDKSRSVLKGRSDHEDGSYPGCHFGTRLNFVNAVLRKCGICARQNCRMLLGRLVFLQVLFLTLCNYFISCPLLSDLERALLMWTILTPVCALMDTMDSLTCTMTLGLSKLLTHGRDLSWNQKLLYFYFVHCRPT